MNNAHNYMRRKKRSENSSGSTPQTPRVNKTSNYSDTPKVRYPALRIISGVYSIFAWIIAVITIIAAITVSSNSRQIGLDDNNGLLAFLIVLFAGCIIVISLFAAAESIKVFIDIEENTRQTAINTRKTE